MIDIVATVGVKSSHPDIIKAMVQAGATMFRLNTGHMNVRWIEAMLHDLAVITERRVPVYLDLLSRDDGRWWHHPNADELLELINSNVDAIGISFCTGVEIVEWWKKRVEAKVFAKIENKEGLWSHTFIANAADGLWIDRGDLATSISVNGVMCQQETIIKTGLKFDKPVYVSTGILKSMENNREPHIGEALGVAQLIQSGVSGLVLAEETARGDYPVEAVGKLRRIVDELE